MKAIAAFWESFVTMAPQWSITLRAGELRSVFESIDQLLSQHGFPYCFDVTTDDETSYFILSPEGDFSLATEIDQLVKAAPDIPGWRILPRRQRKHLQDVFAIIRQLYLVDVSNATFSLATTSGVPLVEMCVACNADLTAQEKQGLVNTFLWHALGEDTVMSNDIRSRLVFSTPAPQANRLTASDLVRHFTS